MSFAEYAEKDARLVMLKELHSQTDGRLNETLLTQVLANWGHNKSREWVRTQMRKLKELGAVRLFEVGDAGDFLVAELTRAGIDHVERRSVIEGIARPSPR